jgi:eukaryotic-like serine/threonine-protein kinase
MASLSPGQLVNVYRVQELIGAGAMGEVFLAIDEGLGRKVALKILADAHRNNSELRARFVREARAVAAIAHPNVVQVHATGEFDGRPWLAMELLSGSDLGSLVRAGQPLTSLEAVSAAIHAAHGLEAAAKAGLIHRDVKPTNLMRLDSGIVKVTDFGLAKPADPGEDPGLTALGVVVGTPDYIAPEQARGDAIDSRVDVYALGCTLFFLLVGRAPFRRGNDEDDKYLKVVARHLRDPAPDPRDEKPETDNDLADLTLEMMAKDPDERPRYPQLIARLERIRARLLGTVPVPASSSSAKSSRQQPRAATGGSRSTRRTPPPSTIPAAEDAATRPRLPSSAPSLSLARSGPRRGPARLLWALTLVSVAVFCTGAGLLLFGPRGQTAVAAAVPDAGVQVVAAPDAAPVSVPVVAPEPPAGMLPVRIGDRTAFFVDRFAVTNKQYAELIKTHKFPTAEKNSPVTNVSFEYAKAYAKMRGKRLVTAGEWDSVQLTNGFAPAGMKYWEWVDDGKPSDKQRPVRRPNGGESKRPATGDKVTTFRLAQDL